MRFFAFAIAVVLATLSSAVAAQPDAPTIVTPNAIKWTVWTGANAGVEMATLAGNPAATGPYTVRLRMPDGGKFSPHFHVNTENVTVISGTLLVGLGDTVNPAAMKELPAGSFVSVPAGVHHYAMAKGKTIIQINGMGPLSMMPVEGKK